MLNCKTCFLLMLALVTSVHSAEAQSYRVLRPGEKLKRQTTSIRQGEKGNVSISVELLAPRQTIGLAAQQWAETFSKMGISCRVRQPILSDKAEVKESKRGKLRFVTIIGILERNGDILFPGRKFSQQDKDKLNDWLREIKTYGAQGSPKGQAVWGLSKKQFDPLYKALSKKAPEELFAMPISQAIKKLKLPAEYPVRSTAEYRRKLVRILQKDPLVRQQTTGLSKGTALALILNDLKLGFYPARTPSGSIELALVTQADVSKVWPVGWETSTQFPKIARKLYQLVPIELKDVKLLDLLHAISVKTEIPVMIDYYKIEGKGIDLEKVIVSYPSRKTSWSRLLRGVTVPNKMTRQYKIDEAGRPFVWITTSVPIKPPKR